MTVSQRIDKVLIDKGLVKKDGSPNYSEAERICDFSNGILSKLANRKENATLSRDKLDTFLRKFYVNREWLLNGNGDPFYADGIETEKTSVHSDIYRDLVEANSDYRLVPKTILNEEYRIMLKSEIDDRQRIFDELIKTKNDLIDELKEDLRILRAQVPAKS